MKFQQVFRKAAFVLLSSLTTVAAVSLPGLSQVGFSPVGQWTCEMGYQGPAGAHTRQFLINIYPNQNFEAQGTFNASLGSYGFYAQGGWQFSGAAINLVGQEQNQSLGNLRFVVEGNFSHPNRFSTRQATRYEQLVSYCNRIA